MLFGLNKNPQQGMPVDAPQVPVLGEGGGAGDDGKQVSCVYLIIFHYSAVYSDRNIWNELHVYILW